MTAKAFALPRTIRANIQEDAINRVSAFFNATTTDILNELLQNARRSGATQVDITTNDKDRTVTVLDDGQGIPNPAAILSFGMSCWDSETARRERPAGMGLYSLACRDHVLVRSKHEDRPAWETELTPEHFTGNTPATVRKIPEHRKDHPGKGTSITFSEPRKTGPDLLRDVLETTRHYPVTVRLNGRRVNRQKDFLADALHVREWQGLRIGVRKTWNNGRLNFYGIVVENPGIGPVRTVQSLWTADVDVLDCPHLELTLPSRKEVVRTPFIDLLRNECLRAIYQTIAAQPEPEEVSKKTQEEARTLGIRLPDARPKLRPWHAAARWEKEDIRLHEKQEEKTVRNSDILISRHLLEIPEQQVLARALTQNPDTPRLMQADQHYEGYEWYDRLNKATGMTVTVQAKGAAFELRRLPQFIRDNYINRPPETRDPRPDRITLALQTEAKDGAKNAITLQTDMAFEMENRQDPQDIRPIVTKNSSITAPELANLMTPAFLPEQRRNADSHDTQLERYAGNCRKAAFAFLKRSKEEALRDTLNNAVQRHIMNQLPYGQTVTIRIRRGQEPEIAIEPAP